MKKGVEMTKLVNCRRKGEWREEQSMRDRQNGSPIDGSIIQPARILLIVAIIAAAAVVGCISQPPGEKVTNETPPPVTTVPPAPKLLYLKAGQFEQFTYWGHNITVNYSSAYPIQTVEVTLDGAERTFKKELTESPIGIYWKEGNLSFTLKAVVWEIRDGQKIPIYESTWNITELYFEVHIGGT
jgi:hypothetical protein